MVGIRKLKLLHSLSARSRVSYLISRRLVRSDELAFAGLIPLFSPPFVTMFRLIDLIKHVFVLIHRRELVLFLY